MLGKRLRNGPEYAESPAAFSEQSETTPKKEKNAKDICFATFFGSKKKDFGNIQGVYVMSLGPP